MSTTIDERVVQFELENKNFERNAAQTKKTLEELDNSLKLKNGAKSFKDVEEAAEKTNFNSLLKAADTVNDRLSLMGMLGVSALNNITNKAVDAGERLVKSLSIDQVTQGYSKYEQKTQAIQTIMNATGLGIEDVNTQLEKLNWFTDETSYNFIDMVSNIGKFTSQQVGLEESVTAMQGIATWAAKSGQGAAEASRAMYNLSQAMGVGSVKLMDWKSIQNANMATAEFKQLAIDTAKALAQEANEQAKLNELQNVTVQNFDQSLSSGWFSKDVLMGVLQEYGSYADKVYDYINAIELSTGRTITAAEAMKELGTEGYELGASAFKAAQEAKTFTEAIDATKDAVSTGWMTTFEHIFGSYDRAKVMWTDLANNLYDIFAVGGESRNTILGDVFDNSWTKLSRQISSTGASMTSLIDYLETTLTDHGQNVDELKEKYGSLADAFKQGAVPASYISNAITRLANDAEKGASGVVNLEEKFKEFTDMATKLRAGDFGQGDAARRAIEEAGYSYEAINKLAIRQHARMETSFQDFQDILDHYGVTLETTTEYTEEEVQALRDLADAATTAGTPMNDIIRGMDKKDGWELLHDSMNNILETVINFKEAISGAWEDIFGEERTKAGLRGFLEGMNTLSERMLDASTRTERFSRICHTLFSILDLGVKSVQVLAAGVGAIARIMKGIIGDLLSYFGVTGAQFDAFEDSVDSKVESLSDSLDDVRDRLNSADYATFKENVFDIVKALDAVVVKLQNFRSQLTKVKNRVQTAIKPLTDWGQGIYQKLLPGLTSMMDSLRPIGENLITNISDPIKQFVKQIQSSEHPIKAFFEHFKDLGSIFTGFKEAAEALLNSEPFKKLKDTLDGYLEPARKSIQEFINSMKNLFGQFETSDWVAMIGGALVFYNITKLSDALYNLSTLGNNISDTFLSLKKLITSKLLTPFAFNLKTIAGSILVLAASMYVLSRIPVDQLKQVALTAVGLMVVLTSLAAALSLIAKPITGAFAKNMLGISLTMVSLATSILILTGALAVMKKLDFQNYDQLGYALLGLLGVAMIMVVTLRWLKMGAVESVKSALMVVSVALGVYLLAVTLKKLITVANAVTFGEMLQLLSVTLIFGMIANAISKLKVKSIAGLVGLLMSISIFSVVFQEINKLSTKELLRGLAGITIILAFLAAVTILMDVLTHYLDINTSSLLKLSASMGLMSIAVLAIAGVMLFVKTYIGNPMEYMTPMVGLAMIVALLGVCLAAAVKLSNGGKGMLRVVFAIAALSTVVFMLAVMLKVMQKLDLGDLTKELILFGEIAAIMAGVMLAMGLAAKLGGGLGIVYIIGFIFGLTAVVAALTVLKETPFKDLEGAVFAIGGVLLALGVAMLIAGGGLALATKNADKIKAGPILAFLGIVAVVSAAAIALTAMNADWKLITALVAGVAGMFVAVAIALAIIGRIKELKIGALLAVAGSVVILGVAMSLMAKAISMLPQQDASEFAKTMIIMVGAIAVLGVVIGLLGKFVVNSKTAMLGVGILSAAILIISGSFLLFAKAIDVLNGVDLSAVASGLMELAIPALDVGMAGIFMILGALGFGAMALALMFLGAAGNSSAAGVLLADMAIQKILLTASAIGAAFSTDGGFFQHLANLKEELVNSAGVAGELAEATAGMIPEQLTTLAATAEPEIEASVSQLTETTTSAIQESGTEVVGAVEEVYGEVVPDAISGAAAKWPKAEGLTGILGLFGLGGEGGLGFSLEGVKGQLAEVFSVLGDFDFTQFTDLMSGNFVSDLGGTFMAQDYSGATGAVQEGLNGALEAVSVADSASKIGGDWVTTVADTITTTVNRNRVKNAATTAMNEGKAGADSVDSSSSGVNFIQGIINGIKRTGSSLYQTVYEVAKQMLIKLQAGLDEHSPSKATRQMGDYFIQGLEIGITKEAPVLMRTIGTVAGNAVDAVNEILQNDGSVMTITPVLDMSNVYDEVDAFKRSGWSDKIEPLVTMAASTPVMKNVSALTAPVETNKQTTTAVQSSTPATYNFTQNNYSPKALSRIEIYRQTKNQFSGFKELVK